MRNAVVIGVAMLGFMVWLWRHEGGSSGSVMAWLTDKNLAELKDHARVKGLHDRWQLLELPLQSLRGEVSKKTFERLEVALEELELEQWLTKKGLEKVVPVLAREGIGSRAELALLDAEWAGKISQELDNPVLSQLFLDTLPDSGSAELSGGKGGGRGWWGFIWWSFLWLVGVAVLVLIVLVVVYIIVGVIGAYILVDVIGYAFALIFVALLTGLTRQRFNEAEFRRNWNAQRRDRLKMFSLGFVGVLLVQLPNALWSLLQRMLRSVNETMTTVGRRAPEHRRRQPATVSAVPRFNLDLYGRLTGRYIDVQRCRVEWKHESNTEVGGSSVATVTLLCRNREPYTLQLSDQLSCSVSHIRSSTDIPTVIEPFPLTGHDTVKVSFTARLAGDYCVDIRINDAKITGATLTRSFQPGPVDPGKTIFTERSHVIVLTRCLYYTLTVLPKDAFGNSANLSQEFLLAEIRRDCPEGPLINPECVVEKIDSSHYEILLKVDGVGHYVGCIKYQGQRIGPPSFTIICLNESEAAEVDKNLSKKSSHSGIVWYEAHTAPPTGKQKRVYCYIFPRQLQVREYFLRVIPTRLFSCRLRPSTQIKFHRERDRFSLDDGFQQPLTLTSPHRELLGATFYRLMLKNIGGSEKFLDKRNYFFAEFKKHHCKESRSDIRVGVKRSDLLKSVMRTTKGFTVSDWCRKFCVTFQGEEGLDWGGVSRELFELLSVECFDPNKELFCRFKDDPQALVHPNRYRPEHLKLKHFKFAGKLVGKCLYESAQGNALLVKARFTRSFLAQLIGLRVNHKYFESDDPDLYVSKIEYIRDSDVTDLDLVFAEEEFRPGVATPRVVPLMEHGEDIEVDEENKMQYLNLLAQYRLVKSCREEMESFLEGLHELVPDHLLSIFDENELELLICGISEIRFKDLKDHSVVSGSGPGFRQVVSWFWTVVSSFTQEELARLLQFVTGCSQVPSGGFQALTPPFKISSAPVHGRLPLAHTCFNQLCLPTYDSCEHFQQSLMIAINEGSEGFGFL